MDIPPFEKYHDQTLEELMADVIEDTDQVVRGLEIQRNPDILMRTFFFDLKDRNVAFPASISGSLGESSLPLYAHVTVEENRLTQTSELSIDIAFDGDGAPAAKIYPSDQERNHFTTSIWFEDGIIHNDRSPTAATDVLITELPTIEPLSNAEVNAFIASIVAPNKVGDYRMYESMDLRSEQTLHHIAEALEDEADESTAQLDYFVDQQLGTDTSQVSFIKVDNRPSAAVIQRSLKKGAVAASVRLDYQNTQESIDDESQAMLRTFTVNTDGESTERECDFDVMVSIHDFLRDLKSKMFDPDMISLSRRDIEDPSSVLNIEESRDLQKTLRDQYGFDSPNTGA